MEKRILFVFMLVLSCIVSYAQVTEIFTDYGGYWKSSSTANNPIQPTNSHNLLGFTLNAKTYSTGVDDANLTAHSVSFIPTIFKALPVNFPIGGTIVSGGSTYIATGSLYDGVLNGYSTPTPDLRIADALTDGINGLNLGTGVTNLPTSATLKFSISAIDLPSVTDTFPDLIFSQTAVPSGAGYSVYFTNSAGVKIGSTVVIAWNASLGTYICDLYNLSNTSCDTAIITTGALINQPKEIRINALQFSDFGVTTAMAPSITKLVIVPGGSSDPAFVAYNYTSFSISTPVITTQPVSQVVCPATGLNATFSVVATGPSLTYQWKKNGASIIGATSSTYTITNVVAADAGSYDVYITNAGGTVMSTIAYLNTRISNQPSPATQTIATGNSVTLSVTASNPTGYQWKKNGTDITGATAASYTINPLTTTNAGSYTVNVINTAGSSCASVLSSAAVVVAATTLYSKSTGNLSVAANWGVNTNGTGSTPLNFTRAEHTFIVSNQTNAATGASLAIAGTLDAGNAITTITPGTLLSAARIIRTGTGTIAGSATSSLSVNGVSDVYFAPGSQLLKNLTIEGGTTTLSTNLSITAGIAAGTVIVNAGTLNTSDSLTLKSDANGTAIIGTSAGTISGKVTIERYIPARRAWRIMAAPVTAASAPTIQAAWQEGATASTDNPAPGFGTHITGGNASSGFDQSANNASSLKYLSAGSWAAVPNTTTTKITDHEGYLFFIRGNRAYDILGTTAATTPSATVLRIKGNVNQGTQIAKVIPAAGYTLLGNPYASPINFSLVAAASTNLKNRFWVWDPQLGGTNGVGAYILLDWDGSTYTSTPSVPLNGIIQPGQAFFVQTANGTSTGSVVINESHKNAATSVIPFGRVQGSTDANIELALKIINPDSSISVADGILTHYNNGYSNDVDNDDAVKFSNNNENISILSGASALSLERRGLPAAADTLKLKFGGIKNAAYQLGIKAANFESTGLQPQLIDKFLRTTTVISPSNETAYTFGITADELSKAADRFSIIFKVPSALPVTFLSAAANIYNQSSVAITWKAGNEINILRYEIERSDEANGFATIGTVAAKNTGSSTNYQFNDIGIPTSNNLYRIKSIDASGEIKYSAVLSAVLKNASAIAIFPNPVTGNAIQLHVQNIQKGRYQYTIVNAVGQVVVSGAINHTSTGVENIKVIKKLPAGSYQFLLSQNTFCYKNTLIVKNE